MATIDDLPIQDFSKLSDAELLDLIKERRRSRREPAKEVKAQTVKKAQAKKKRGKPAAFQDFTHLTKDLTPEQASALLKQLRGE